MSKSKLEQEIRKLVKISKYSDNIAYDLRFIYSDRIHHYGKIADEYELYRIMEHHKVLSEFSVKPDNSNRIYVVSGMECIMAICLEVSDVSIKKIIDSLKVEVSLSDPFPYEDVDTSFITTIYVFSGEKVVYSADLFPYWLGVLVQAFRNKNIIRHGDTDNWFKD